MKKFKDYINENILDKMVSKTDEEIEQELNKFVLDLKERASDPNTMVHDYFFILEGIYPDRKKLLNDLLEEGLDVNDVLIDIVDDADEAKTDREKQYKVKLMNWMYNLIEKNKDKIDTDDLYL